MKGLGAEKLCEVVSHGGAYRVTWEESKPLYTLVDDTYLAKCMYMCKDVWARVCACARAHACVCVCARARVLVIYIFFVG